ncbi:MAG: hypothetical protein KDK76_07135 [Chlamydiia bacterium]|nr:hypothetical protein [Chlamydiia bacterium]
MTKKILVELALAAGRRHQSPQTGLIHYCNEDEASRDTIPFYQNFCFCLALLRSLIGEHIQEAKERLMHLLSFQNSEGHFPIYLHEYPSASPYSRASYPLKLIEKHFAHVLGEDIRAKLKTVAPLPHPPNEVLSPKSAADIAYHLEDLSSLAPYYDQELHLYVGPLNGVGQRGGEVELTLFELFMANATQTFSPRLLAPHPVHMEGALIFPSSEIKSFPKKEFQGVSEGEGFHLFRKVWKEGDLIHTLVCQNRKIRIEENTFVYPEEIPDEKKRSELSFYVNAHPSNEIMINGEKGTVFRFGDRVQIGKTHTLIFEKMEGEGDVMGHISKGNRPSQIDPDIYTAHDWKISLRTLRRSPKFRLKLSLHSE